MRSRRYLGAGASGGRWGGSMGPLAVAVRRGQPLGPRVRPEVALAWVGKAGSEQCRCQIVPLHVNAVLGTSVGKGWVLGSEPSQELVPKRSPDSQGAASACSHRCAGQVPCVTLCLRRSFYEQERDGFSGGPDAGRACAKGPQSEADGTWEPGKPRGPQAGLPGTPSRAGWTAHCQQTRPVLLGWLLF